MNRTETLGGLAVRLRAAQNRVVKRSLVAVVLASALAVGCGGHEQQGRHGAAVKAPPAVVDTGRPGKLVAIGGGRNLYVDCVGSGSPTVVLEAGLGADTFSWRDVQPQLGRTTRTCSYDRAGTGSSVATPGVRDARDDVDDLQRLLTGPYLDPPYVLVGHSYGGLLVRLFARAHPEETAGLVLVDAKGRDQTRRELAIWPKSQAPALRRAWARPVKEGVDLAAGDALGRRVTTLDDTPLAVVTAGTHAADSRGMPPPLARALYRLWVTMQDELAALSSDHVHVVALRSDHWVASRRFYRGNQRIDGQPEVVIRAVRAVVAAARDGTRLPPCRRLFRQLVVDCRG
jgi:pimeloyl-ACP methyl ester carboxylesterase